MSVVGEGHTVIDTEEAKSILGDSWTLAVEDKLNSYRTSNPDAEANKLFPPEVKDFMQWLEQEACIPDATLAELKNVLASHTAAGNNYQKIETDSSITM